MRQNETAAAVFGGARSRPPRPSNAVRFAGQPAGREPERSAQELWSTSMLRRPGPEFLPPGIPCLQSRQAQLVSGAVFPQVRHASWDSDRADSTTQCSVQQITRHTQKVGRGPGALCHGLFYRLNDRRRKNSASASACWFLKLLPDGGRHRAREMIPY